METAVGRLCVLDKDVGRRVWKSRKAGARVSGALEESELVEVVRSRLRIEGDLELWVSKV